MSVHSVVSLHVQCYCQCHVNTFSSVSTRSVLLSVSCQYIQYTSAMKCCQQHDSTMLVIQINWTSPTTTYHTLIFWLQSHSSQSLHENFTRCLRAARRSIAKYLSEEECNEELHFPVSYYCNFHTNSCKNYKKSQLYNTKHYLIITCVL